MIHNFEKLECWERGCQLAVDVYNLFRESREFAFRDQMVRASLSIPSNIAEGSERGTEPDFVRFLRYSKGSSGELRTQAYVAEKLGILEAADARAVIGETRQLSAMIEGLIRSLR